MSVCPLLLLLSHVSRVQLLATPWTASYQVPLSMGFFQARILEWVDLPDPGIELVSHVCVSPALAGRFFTIMPPGKPSFLIMRWLQMVTAAMKLKDSCSLEEKL